VEKTPNYGLKKPAQIDFYDVDDFNHNADIIDEELKKVSNEIETKINTEFEKKADLNSPAFTGTPTAPTQSASDNSTKLATTAYVTRAINNHVTAEMPHQFTVNGVTYRWGLAVINGVVNVLYEEI